MKKKAIILIGILIVSSIFMISAGANYSQTIEQNQCPGGHSQSNAVDTFFVFTDVPRRPIGDGTLTVTVRGDYDYYGSIGSEALDVIVVCTSLGVWLPGWQCSYSLITKTFTVTQSQLLQWSKDGKIEVKLVQGASRPGDNLKNNQVNCFCAESEYDYEGGCNPAECGNINIVTLEYRGVNNSLPMNWIIKKFGLGNKE